MTVERMSADDAAQAFDSQKRVKRTRAGRTCILTQDNTKPEGFQPVCKPIGEGMYMRRDTGEVGEYKRAQNRAESIESLKRSVERLRLTIDANTTEKNAFKWLTLTYASNITDIERLYRDYKRFTTRLKRAVGHFEYIAVPEPQERGAWHMHVLLIWKNTDIAPYIPPWTVAAAWKEGFIKIQNVEKIQSVGRYLTSYLCNIKRENGAKNKGARLYLYPSGMNLYRCSKGIKKPVVDHIEPQLIKRKTFSYQQGFSLLNENGEKKGTILRKEYTTKKRGGQD